MPNIDESFNPQEYTVKELLKILYLDINEMKKELLSLKNDHSLEREIIAMGNRITRLETQDVTRAEEQKKLVQANTKWMAGIGLFFTLINVAISLFL